MINDEANQTENQNQSPPSGNPVLEPNVPTPENQTHLRQVFQPESLQTSGQSNAEQTQNAEQATAGQPGISEEEKKRHHLVLLEAALYVAGRPLDLNEICAVINSRSKKRAQQLVKELTEGYAARSTALEILQLRDERYVLQLKAEYTPLVKKFVNRPLLSAGPLKTLSYIAYRQPISQKRVIEVRGQHAYGHVKMLLEMDLIVPERNGRSIVLRTTDYFADYFGLAQDTTAMKRDLKRIFGDFPVKIEQQADSQQQAKDEQ